MKTPTTTAATPNWYTIRAAQNPDTAEVLIYGDIGDSWFGESVTAQQFVKDLQAVADKSLVVRINSYGGSVSDGVAIYNAIKRHPQQKTVEIDGVAVSIASLIAMAGDKVNIAENALFMVHAPWGYAAGNAIDMRKYADLLDKYAEAMATSYANKTGASAEEMYLLLSDGVDHWYSAQEAKDAGFVDSVTSNKQDEESARYMQAALARFKVPAAAAARFAAVAAQLTPHKEIDMSEVKKESAAGPNADDVVAIETAARAKEVARIQARNADIKTAFARFMARDGVSQLYQECIANPTLTVQDANNKLLAKLAEGVEPAALASAGTDISMGRTADQKRADGMEKAIFARAGMAKDDAANEWRGYSLIEIARTCAEAAGQRVRGMSKMDVVAAAFTTSDFPNLLANVAEKSMLKGWEEAEETFEKWTNRGTLGDFKTTSRVDLGIFPALDAVPDGGEYRYATLTDRAEQITLATYGKLFSISRQTIINDDLGAFTRVPTKMGRAAKRTVGNLVYAVLTGNPTMADSIALFHASHNNLLTAAAIATASVDAMRVAMAKQKDPDANATALNIRLAYLLVPVALEGLALQVANSEYEVGATNKNNTVANYMRSRFEVVSDARLDAASASNWYGAADPNIADTIEVAYLDGQDKPFLDTKDGWTRDGTEFKVRLDAAVKALDPRTLAKNPN